MGRWGIGFDPDRLATLETRMWKAYYRRQPARLFGWLVLALREQAGASWPTALRASLHLTRAAAGFSRADADYDRFAADIAGAYRRLGLPADVDAEEVAAWIKLKPGSQLSEDEVKSYCRGQVAHFKVPRYVVFVEEYPTTVTGKIQKFKLRELGVERFGLQQAAGTQTA